MPMRRTLLGTALAAFLAVPALAQEAQTIGWRDLLPERAAEQSPLFGAPSLTSFTFTRQPGVVRPPGYTLKNEQLRSRGLREDLDGQTVRIPGFVRLLEQSMPITRFVLVPYQGNCDHIPSHVPPPPADQIILVTAADGLEIENPEIAVWVTGTLEVGMQDTPYAEVGYHIADPVIEFYEE
jgi:hypothetical protein